MERCEVKGYPDPYDLIGEIASGSDASQLRQSLMMLAGMEHQGMIDDDAWQQLGATLEQRLYVERDSGLVWNVLVLLAIQYGVNIPFSERSIDVMDVVVTTIWRISETSRMPEHLDIAGMAMAAAIANACDTVSSADQLLDMMCISAEVFGEMTRYAAQILFDFRRLEEDR